MANYDEVVRRWIDIAIYGSTKDQYKNDRLLARGDSIFSYGSHFEIGRLIRDKKGQSSHWLLNGNTYSNTTSKHQGVVRGAVQRTSLPVVTIPYAALDQAQVILSSVKILEVTSDWWQTIDHWEKEKPAAARWEYETRTVEGSGGYQHIETGEWIEDFHERDKRVLAEVGAYKWGNEEETHSQWWARKEIVHNKWRELPRVTKNTGRKTLKISKNSWQEWELVDVEGEVHYHRTTQRHWLGESLIEAEVQYLDTPRCTRCKGTRVHEGDTAIRRVDIQGPARTEWERYPVTGIIDVPSCDMCNGAGRTRRNRTRKTKFLSGFDRGETRPSYFFCELPPKSMAVTVEDALEDLKPSAVKVAEQMGREVKRQGDIFGVPVQSLDKRALTKAGARFAKAGQLMETNHVATEVAYMKDGRIFARGTLRHAPQFRRPDHKRVPLGKDWHLILKNTVPIAT